MLELFKIGARLALDKGDFDRGVKDADESGKGLAESLEKSIDKVKNFLKNSAIVALAVKGAQAVWNLAKSTSEAGDRIDKQSQALGFSRKAYQEWEYILRQSGASIDDMGMAMKTMQEVIAGNSAEAAAGLSKLGLSAAHLQSLSPEDQFETLVKAFQQMPEGAEKSRLAIQLFGRNAQSLMPLLNSSADELDGLRQRAHDLGLIMSDEDVDASVAFGDALDDLNAVWGALKQKFGAQLLPGFTKGIVAAANALGRITNAVSDAFKTGDWKTVFKTLTEEISNFIPGIIDTVVNIATGLFENADKIIDLAISIVNGLADGLAKALPKLVAKLPQIARSLLNGFKNLGKTIGNSVIDIINGVFGTNIPHIDEIRWPTWPEVQLAFSKAWDAIQDEAAKLMKLIFGETEDGGIDWPDPATVWTKVSEAFTTFWNGLASFMVDAATWVIGLFGLPEVNAEKLKTDVSNWFGGFSKTIVDACSWVLGLFGLPTDVNTETLKADVEQWFSGLSGVLVEACNWLLGIFGLPEVNTETLKTDVSNWFNGFVDTIVDACSWFLGLFGLPTDVNHETLKADVSKWFSGLVGTIVEACNWLLNLFGLPEVNTEQLKTDVSNWFGGFASTIIDACSWVLGLFGLPTDVDLETLKSDVSTWFDGIKGVVQSACSWVLSIFGVPDEDSETIQTLVGTWFDSVREFVEGACTWVLSLFGFAKDSEVSDHFKKWWGGEDGTGGIRGLIIGLADWMLGKLGFPDTETIREQIRTWWAGVINDLGLSVLFGVEPPGGGSSEHGGGDGTSHGGGGHSFAKGLNYVPYDGYVAVLHRGETILNQSQGREWRQNGGSGLDMRQLYESVASAVAAAVSGIAINMDGKAVGNAVTEQVSRNLYLNQLGRRFATP